jgi:aminoglycoside 6'-N-acetyltransferase
MGDTASRSEANPGIAFRPLERADLVRLRSWLNAPHVHRWWGRNSGPGSLGGSGAEAATAEEVEAKYGPGIDAGGPTHRYIITCDGVPAGLIQWYRLADFADHARAIGEDPSGAAGIDLFIGEPGLTGRGLGARALDAFVTSIVFHERDLGRVVAGPAEGNARSIRAFEKAGFRLARHASVPGEPEREAVMVRRAE